MRQARRKGLPGWSAAALAAVGLVSCDRSGGGEDPLAGGGGGSECADPLELPPPPLEFAPLLLDLAPTELGRGSAPQTFCVTNRSAATIELREVFAAGAAVGEFEITSPGVEGIEPVPLGEERSDEGAIRLAPGQGRTFEVVFRPRFLGLRAAEIRVDADLPADLQRTPRLRGVGMGPPGEEHRIAAGLVGSAPFVDAGGAAWAPDFGFSGGATVLHEGAVSGTPDPDLYRTQRSGTSFEYRLDLPRAGVYRVVLHLAEMELASSGARTFDVHAEGELLFDDLDAHAAAGPAAAVQVAGTVEVSDGELELSFAAAGAPASVAAIEVAGVPFLAPGPARLHFGAVSAGDQAELPLVLENRGFLDLTIDTIELRLGGSGSGETFSLELPGTTLSGGPGDVAYPVDVEIPARQSLVVPVAFAPTSERYDAVDLILSGSFGSAGVELTGLGGHQGDPFLHVVIEGPSHAVDYEGDGSERVLLDGTLSHTHEPGHGIVGFEWTDAGGPIGSDPQLQTTLPLGPHTIGLRITDDNVPARTLAGSIDLEVVAPTAVPGVLARYYPAPSGGAGALLDAVPGTPEFAEILANTRVEGPSSVGGSPYTQDVLVQLVADVDLETGGTYELLASGGTDRRVLVNGLPASGPLVLSAGVHELEARFAVDGLGDLPLEVLLSAGGAGALPLDPARLSHDQTALVPVINSMPTAGTDLGGNLIVIEGLGFFPSSLTVVHWGALELTEQDFGAIAPERIELVSPPGSGAISVWVESPSGTSNVKSFSYSPTGPVPISFAAKPAIDLPSPTSGTWGPDGRFYVLALNGSVTAIEFDEDYEVLEQVTYAGVSGLSNHDALGIAVNPHDPPDPVRLYVAHGKLFAQGGTSFQGPSPYQGEVSVLTGPDFDQPQPLITSLPVSNHDHGVNGLVFDDNGDLLISVGGNTNAGVRHPSSGDLPESPLSGAILKAETSKGAGFDGAVAYVESATGLPSYDQVDGEEVEVVPGVDVRVHASGVRNAYDLVYTTGKRLYTIDNGPNTGFGAASTGPATELPDPYDVDEFLLVEAGSYHGHPNRARARFDARQYVYRGTAQPDLPSVFVQAIGTISSSTNGIDEYRSEAFGGQMRGDLVAQKWAGHIRRVELSSDGRSVETVSNLAPWTGGLGVRTGPRGALLSMVYNGNGPTGQLVVLVPDDPTATALAVHDVTPWRAPAGGGHPFTIGGAGFGTLATTTVHFDGIPATLFEVTPRRIRGLVPSHAGTPAGPVDVSVSVSGESATLQAGFVFLAAPGDDLGVWRPLASAPTPLGEVAAAQVDGVLYLVGQGSWQTLAYDLVQRLWLPNRSARIHQGHHHAAEVVGGKLYLIGGLGGGSEGKVQIYDPATDTWSPGADMPWAGGSVSTAVIGGKIYAAGGIVGLASVTNCALYDPAADSWAPLAPMPRGRNHTAAGTDGELFYVLGGRDLGNWVTNGYADVQIYDPVADAWQASGDGSSGLAPMPVGRGGMGKAVFWDGELYVFGGETQDGPGAEPGTNVYSRVDVYDPVTNSWRLESPMPVPRHGIHPVLFQGLVFVATGGTSAGTSMSDAFDVFTRQ